MSTAQESIRADRICEQLHEGLPTSEDLILNADENDREVYTTLALVAIAFELRAARIYSNYLEGAGSSKRAAENRRVMHE